MPTFVFLFLFHIRSSTFFPILLLCRAQSIKKDHNEENALGGKIEQSNLKDGFLSLSSSSSSSMDSLLIPKSPTSSQLQTKPTLYRFLLLTLHNQFPLLHLRLLSIIFSFSFISLLTSHTYIYIHTALCLFPIFSSDLFKPTDNL